MSQTDHTCPLMRLALSLGSASIAPSAHNNPPNVIKSLFLTLAGAAGVEGD